MASRDQHRHVCVTSLALAVSVPAEGASSLADQTPARVPQGSCKQESGRPEAAIRLEIRFHVKARQGNANTEGRPRVSMMPLLDRNESTYSREDEVLEGALVNLLEGARAGAGLLGARAAGLLAHHAALADEDDVAVRELLLEL